MKCNFFIKLFIVTSNSGFLFNEGGLIMNMWCQAYAKCFWTITCRSNQVLSLDILFYGLRRFLQVAWWELQVMYTKNLYNFRILIRNPSITSNSNNSLVWTDFFSYLSYPWLAVLPHQHKIRKPNQW